MHFLIAFALYFTHHSYMEIHGKDYYPCFTQPANLRPELVRLCEIQPLSGYRPKPVTVGPTPYPPFSVAYRRAGNSSLYR